MTIDEAIAHAREVVNSNKTKAAYDDEFLKRFCTSKESCIKCAEEHEQLAEWLEELKAYRTLDKTNFSDGYNKAIDDFTEKLNAKCDGMIKEQWNSNVAPISWAEAYADFKDDIEEIAEQLKAGVYSGTDNQ